MKRLVFAVVLLLSPAAWAEVVSEDAWVRLPPPVADTAAGYLILRNTGDAPVELIGAESPVSSTVEFHHMSMHEGMMHMKQMEKMTVPSHGDVVFESGGNHLMLVGLKKELQAGDVVNITLHLAGGGKLAVSAEVRDTRSRQMHGLH